MHEYEMKFTQADYGLNHNRQDDNYPFCTSRQINLASPASEAL